MSDPDADDAPELYADAANIPVNIFLTKEDGEEGLSYQLFMPRKLEGESEEIQISHVEARK